MRTLLNTLYVTTQKSYLGKDGETVAVNIDRKVVARIPVHTLSGIVCFGNVGMSPFLMGFCAEKEVGVSFLTERGRFLSRVVGPVSGNVLVRRTQYRRADCLDASAEIARACVIGKIANSRAVLGRALRDHGDRIDAVAVKEAVARLGATLKELGRSQPLDTVRGLEGDAARAYFGVLDHLVLINKEAFRFAGRNRRPPTDAFNALISFLYTLLLHDIRSALETTGLDPAVGFLHRDRPGRPGLALDLMEEFRAFVADRLALSLINQKQVLEAGFEKMESGAVIMTEETRKAVIAAYQKRKQDEILHPFLGEKVKIGQLFFLQAQLLNRYFRDDLDGYPPFVWR
ncbi:type I-C CRISPR-associated endonuclease Cas1c [Desulfoluna sp.]|uniref:type I-C CRISPR-associated endonuclease Cas1c n=1 Tax=Desulfoluna sp. TaxID=2045199 RepID=UPI002634C7A7|nr:type I-C CRISPR-associated endonuclease Cas1c [Desulfoluna sp.]